jgi:hypothetical protein
MCAITRQRANYCFYTYHCWVRLWSDIDKVNVQFISYTFSGASIFENSERGFLEYDKIDKVYKTTPFGFRFLELHGEMSQILNVQQELELSRR